MIVRNQIICRIALFLALLAPALVAHARETNIVQQAEVEFPGVGKATVRMIETVGQAPTLEIVPEGRKRKSARFAMGRGDDFYVIEDMNSLLRCQARFKILNLKGFPDPLIVALAVTPGGSGHGFEMELVGVVGGRFQRLSQKRLQASNLGGFHVGDLGEGRVGVAVWDFIWADGESHYEPHRFTFTLYGANARTGRLFLLRKQKSAKKYDDRGQGAARELNLPVRNLLDDIPEFKDFISEL
jgi:hypothetical protein